MVLRPVATTHCKAAGLRSSHSILRSHKARLGNLQKGLKCSSFHAYHQLLAPASSHSSPAVLQHHSFVLSSKSLLHTRRSASTVTRPPSTISPSPAAGVASDETRLTWNRFLQLRAVRRRFNIVASIISATGTVALGASVLTSIDLDTFSAHLPFGLDPIFALGRFTLGCGALGWLLGPFAGNAAFGWYYRGLRKEITMVSGSLPNWCGVRIAWPAMP